MNPVNGKQEAALQSLTWRRLDTFRDGLKLRIRTSIRILLILSHATAVILVESGLNAALLGRWRQFPHGQKQKRHGAGTASSYFLPAKQAEELGGLLRKDHRPPAAQHRGEYLLRLQQQPQTWPPVCITFARLGLHARLLLRGT